MKYSTWHDVKKVKPMVGTGCVSDLVILATNNLSYALGRYYDGDDGCFFMDINGKILFGIIAWQPFEEYDFAGGLDE